MTGNKKADLSGNGEGEWGEGRKKEVKGSKMVEIRYLHIPVTPNKHNCYVLQTYLKNIALNFSFISHMVSALNSFQILNKELICG